MQPKLTLSERKVMRKGPRELHVSSVSRLGAGERTAVPLYLCRVSAGSPPPPAIHVERDIDLNEWLIRNKLATYIVRVEGDSMIGEIHPDDRLVIDRLSSAKTNLTCPRPPARFICCRLPAATVR